ncbi:MAG: endonuclease domain-containing protein [Alphaproteobacteria bacterium]|nr:endonuclease domain-containing protein [Alphaproteobacteria bacterium]MBV9825496.1 endonuclease domain-containing protein [Alphaproteobacteria bacterium]
MRGGRTVRDYARNLRRNMTDAERSLWYQLRRNQLCWRFHRQFPIPPYIVDFACVEARLIVEADGSQHAVAGEHEERDSFLREQGLRVLRFWNNDILGNRAGVLEAIWLALRQPAESPLPDPPPLAGEGRPGRGSGADVSHRD